MTNNTKKIIIIILAIISLGETFYILNKYLLESSNNTTVINEEAMPLFNEISENKDETYDDKGKVGINNENTISNILIFHEELDFEIEKIEYSKDNINIFVNFTSDINKFLNYLLELEKRYVNIEEISILSKEDNVIKGYLIIKISKDI
ncbi:hypothetical protein [Clostridium algidicarnis]|uniref:hypothetical protein n=1 Tax=Clostridium algidicarnis TaxID=37659 RepID=UPI001C0E4484|nr:hypothetical protein [Clostridium algidicarnis]MBU3195473.1 hypothetical protein [Clostridium algidicarnis]MBU3208433.1 hypothetical protein [Clostridium algidicarnis]MBU3226971.1 hypothetical protein [Clostridium algidicarnis]MBU3250118.1 hypothetical protein [Clostridium algidicarnis]